jgi:uncharacterized protein (TIGR00159 family)
MKLFEIGFLEIRLLDLVDILLVGGLIYLLYKLVRSTIAYNIFLGMLFIYLFWLLVEALNMQLLSSIMGQFIGAGVLALLILFQQEIRRFLLFIGRNSVLFNQQLTWNRLLPWNWQFNTPKLDYEAIIGAVRNLSQSKTGALIVIAKTSELRYYASTGISLDAELSDTLLEAVFFKNSPLHDGGVIIADNRIKAASCILPLSESITLSQQYGLRHRAGLGISEQTDALAVMVSEETGKVSVAEGGILDTEITISEFKSRLQKSFLPSDLQGVEVA